MNLSEDQKIWKFPGPLTEAKLLGRRLRFLADVKLADGELVTAHCPNTGSMKTCLEIGGSVFLSHHNDPKRKLAYTWELTKTSGGYIGVNTMVPNQVTAWAIERQLIPELIGYSSLKKEVKYGKNSRIDILLDDHKSKPRCYVEVKNTTLLYQDHVAFPDAVTERGLKHLLELESMVREGARAVMFYFVNRPEGIGFRPADHIDSGYGEGLRSAAKAGVEILAYRVKSTLVGMQMDQKMDVNLS